MKTLTAFTVIAITLLLAMAFSVHAQGRTNGLFAPKYAIHTRYTDKSMTNNMLVSAYLVVPGRKVAYRRDAFGRYNARVKSGNITYRSRITIR